MTDYFAVLAEARRPWIDPETLKARFVSLSRDAHPDRVHGESDSNKQAATLHYTDLNAAYTCLREPKARLRHLLELERGTRPKEVQPVPPDTMDLFFEVGQICRSVDAFLTGRNRVDSPLLKAQLFEEGFDWTEKINALQQRLATRLGALDEELRNLNPAWETAASLPVSARAHALPLARVEEMYQLYGYLTRWMGQLQERLTHLSL
jgi:hypothetical protein